MYLFKSQIRYSECDSQARLSLAGLLNYFQDCSTFQSEVLGVGGKYLKENNLVWVLSSWQIVVNRYPGLCEEVETGTFPYGFKGCFGYRRISSSPRWACILYSARICRMAKSSGRLFMAISTNCPLFT